MKFPLAEWVLASLYWIMGLFMTWATAYPWIIGHPGALVATLVFLIIGWIPLLFMGFLQTMSAILHTEEWRAQRDDLA